VLLGFGMVDLLVRKDPAVVALALLKSATTQASALAFYSRPQQHWTALLLVTASTTTAILAPMRLRGSFFSGNGSCWLHEYVSLRCQTTGK
jgi:hypothetical protein